MAFSRRITTVVLVLLFALTLLSSAEASLFDTIRQKLSAFTTPAVEVATAAPESVVQKPKHEGKRVAIIGAGSAGSSSAYYLRRFLANSTVDKLPLDITVYEKHSYVGGRSTTVNAYDDPTVPIELGASIFVAVNYNLVNAANELGLTVSSASAKRPRIEEESDILGVFDGKELLFTYPEGKWWSLAKLIYRYGPMAPYRTKKLTEETVGKFLQMYKPPHFPFTSLSEAVEAIGLLPATGTTGQQFLEQNGIVGDFAQELIQASTRVNYGQNLGLIHGLETMVCMAAEGAMSVDGGNWRIFRGMVDASNVELRLQTSVTSLSKDEDGQWVVSSKADGGAATSEVYDSVIIAGPLQFSNIAINAELDKTPDVIPFVTLHVTLFSSPLRLDPVFFGLKAGQPVPQAILTTLNETERSDPAIVRGEGKHAVGNSGFFSVSTLRSVVRPLPDGSEGGKIEYVYKVFSPERFSDEKIGELLGVKVVDKSATITWMHRHVWKSYPYEYPRVTFEESKLAEGLWYTGGIEAFISTMETSSLMGMNVAQLMVNEWAEEKQKEEEAKHIAEEQKKLAKQLMVAQTESDQEKITAIGDEL
ncbi:prenylcysteine oxidase [Sphaerosporella brunnea]|uniref:Prenylcysteine oxidase n=1 Tax=Sphaerosporella brunnea TaxID=1250544 RepID=A0A5J5EXJ8_9PEZI|nr:prenylcysteine oxidase [Sphaerosporella brunnea]